MFNFFPQTTMKKLLVTFLTIGTLQTAFAYDYPYLLFQTSDGSMQALAVEELTISFADGQLVATNADGSQTFPLAQLSKMYFSADNITNIQTVEQTAADIDETTEIYDLQGRKVTRQQMRQGIYILKSRNGIRKVNVK